MTQAFFRVEGKDIVRGRHKKKLRGVNLGGFLMMEGYIMQARNIAAQVFKKNFREHLGQKALEEFEAVFHKTFIQKQDIARIKTLGCNCIRVPFNCRLIETQPFTYDLDGVTYLDTVIRWAKEYGIYVILDLHAAPGAQNHDWHGDSTGKAELWTSRDNQKRALCLWAFLADRYKNETAVAGYDLLNEAVVGDIKKLNRFYRDATHAIRAVDKNHILFVEGNNWAMDLTCLDDLDDDNWAYSIHFYHPLEYTFNFIPQLSYPLKGPEGTFGPAKLKSMVGDYARFASKKKRPVFVGEFGINSRQGFYGDDLWLKDILAYFDEYGFHWTYWTYKAVKNALFPDGIYSYFPNDPWVNRHGPKLGWETYSDFWKTHKKAIICSWKTENFTLNPSVAGPLKAALKR